MMVAASPIGQVGESWIRLRNWVLILLGKSSDSLAKCFLADLPPAIKLERERESENKLGGIIIL